MISCSTNISRHLILLILIFLVHSPAYAQIVNVEAKRIQTDSTGWSGSLGGDFNFTKSTTRVFSANAFATVQYNTKRNIYLLLGNYGFLKGDKEKLIDNVFLHVRFDHKFTDFLRWEYFVQYQNNKMTKIDTRFLLGTGPRFKLPSPEKLKLFLGISFMYEYEKEIVKPLVEHRVFRNSSYIALTFTPGNYLKLTSTTFYQPRLDHFADFRILNQETADLTVTQKLSVILNWNYVYDPYPVQDVPKINFTFSSGFKYVFNP